MSPETHAPQGLAIFGAGGSGREIAWLAREVHGDELALLFVVDRGYAEARTVDGIEVVQFAELVRNRPQVPVVIAIGDPADRRRRAQACIDAGLRFQRLVHPGVERSHRVSIGEGSVVCAGCVLTVNVHIGAHVQVNVGSTISHDVRIGDFATISPGVHIAGWVQLGAGAFVGTGATIVNGCARRPLIVGANAVIGAGACVIGDVAADTTVVGVPARATERGSSHRR